MDDKAQLNISTVGDVVVVSFAGASVGMLSGIDEMADQLRGYIEQQHPNKIVVDFEGVKFFSSQVLGLLVEIWRKLTGSGGKVLICRINPQLYRVFKITNLDRIFEFYPDRTAAIEALGGT